MGFKKRIEVVRTEVAGVPRCLHVVAAANKADIESAIAAHLTSLAALKDASSGSVSTSAPALWTSGAAEWLAAELPTGFVVDLSMLKPDVQYLVLFLAEVEDAD